MSTMNPTTAPGAQATHSKHYVFVDEYNRHKRLKVMRACDGCRKRKIRCDGALQNGPWPCGACLRLKLKCIPPSLDQDDDQLASEGDPGQFTFSTSTTPTNNSSSIAPVAAQFPVAARPVDMTSQTHPNASWPIATPVGVSNMPTPVSLDHSLDGGGPYAAEMFHPHVGRRMDPTFSDDEYFETPSSSGQSFMPPGRGASTEGSGPVRTLQTQLSVNSADDAEEAEATVRELTDQMGDLTVDHLSVAPWIANQKKNQAEIVTVEEADVLLPPAVLTDPTVKIPLEMMPAEERCMDYFGYYFAYIHPYIPVLNRKRFYDQWRSARHTLSPLLLEAIFACVAAYLEEIVEVRRWLALAARHEESFKDVPRLSTIQAMLLLTKAREYVPKRGYYYRSWMSTKYMITMAIDLGLNEHYDKHRFGNSCRLPRADCMMRTRIWQTLFVLELLVGAPQGRTDFTIELETVDLTFPTPSPDLDSFEYQTQRRSGFFTQCARNIKVTNRMWQLMRWQKKDWALDPSFTRHNEDLDAWVNGLPSDMQIPYEDDGSPPVLHNDHFVAYLHIYHHLIVIMHHRPQLQTLLEKRDPNWRIPLNVCLHAGMRMCQIQEALLIEFAQHGLRFMTRGINFSIYCVLSCTMLHLAAITSPDPEMNINARNYFTRHMRVLEQCASGASNDVQVQIDTLREAFSADTSMPFELKPTLGLKSPSIEDQPTPPSMQQGPNSAPVQSAAAWSQLSDAKAVSASPDYNGTPYDAMNNRSPYAATNFNMPASGAYVAQQQGYPMDSPLGAEQTHPVWDPSGIFNHWATAFGGGGPQGAPPPAPPTAASGPSDMGMPLLTSAPLLAQPQPGATATPQQQALYASQRQSQQQQMPPSHAAATNSSPAVNDAAPAMPAITPHMWQDVFTNAYVSGHGQKRYRDEDQQEQLTGSVATGGLPYEHLNKRRG